MKKYFNCLTDKPALFYKSGEKISIKIVPKADHEEIECQYIHWSIRGDDGKYKDGFGSARPGEPLCLETSMDTPGFVRITCVAFAGWGAEDKSFDVLEAGVGVDVEKLSYCDTLPEDFDKYWADIEKLVADFECRVILREEIDSGVPKDFKAYDVRISTPSGRPASGIVTMPRGEGTYPIRVSFNGYGYGPARMGYLKNTICANFNAHGFENNLCETELKIRYADELRKNENGCEYGFDEKRNADKMNTYWRNMMIRNLIAVKYLKTLPQWNRAGLTAAGGSQGAFQATTVAAHDHDVTFLEIRVPWFCNLNAENHGFIGGWRPKFAEGLRYFDTVAQSTRVKCPVKIVACLGDTCCPPSTTMTLYNAFRSEKSIAFIQGGQHSYLPPEPVSFHCISEANHTGCEIKKGTYRHYKGTEYTVLELAYDSETLEEIVVYKANDPNGKVWVRPKWMFGEYVNLNGLPRKRFEYISE